MHNNYEDIRTRIAEQPMWFDEHGTPRYAEFHPRLAANIYAEEAVLLRIECQGCGHPFDVCLVSDSMDQAFERPTLSELAEKGQLDYHDPPNIGCCPAGPTMSSVARHVLQFWTRTSGGKREWRRLKKLERPQECTWEHDND